MDLEELIQVMDRAEANLAKLDAILTRAEPMMPKGPSRGSSREYDDLRRSWHSLLEGLPRIDGWTVTVELPDADELGQAHIDYLDIGELSVLASALQEAEAPGRELDNYRFRLGQARRRAIRDRLSELIAKVDENLPEIVKALPQDPSRSVESTDSEEIKRAISEIERPLGNTTERRGRWVDLHRHLQFSQGYDWRDIANKDWPSARQDIESACITDSDPYPVPKVDLGTAASSHPVGGVTTQLNWSAINDDQFERLLFDLLRELRDHQNVEWLMKTRAPDKGRDLSLERVLRVDGGTTRTERVMVQAKHWISKSVAPQDVLNSLASLPTWEPPRIHILIIATSGRFSVDAVRVVERHNDEAKLPFIEL